MQSRGLHAVSDEELTRLLRAIFRDEVRAPISRRGLLLGKWSHIEAHLEGLIGHSKEAALAIVSAVLRERNARPDRGAKLLWNGPAPTGTGALAPYPVMLELIANASRSVLLTAADLVRDQALLRALHAAQRGRELAVRVVLQASAAQQPELARLVREQFRERAPWPSLYVLNVERAIAPLPSCLIVDSKRAVLLAGASVEVEPDDRQISAGLLMEDPQLAALLEQQWTLLIEQGALLPLAAALPD